MGCQAGQVHEAILMLLFPPPLQKPLPSSHSTYFLVEKETGSLKPTNILPSSTCSVSSIGLEGQSPHWTAGLLAPSARLSQPLRYLGLE